jgi:hypothetical protein
MPADIHREVLLGRWVHSHEEDQGDEAVYRPASWAFPPSRGRGGFELRQDGTLRRWGPGPVDRPQESTGRWRLDGDQLVLEGPGSGEKPRRLRVMSASEDRLVVTT